MHWLKLRAAPIERFASSDNTEVAPVEEATASATGGVAAAIAGYALLCHVEHAAKATITRTRHSCKNDSL